MYSMLKVELNIKENVDISTYHKLKAFLKRKAVGYKAKKSKTLTAAEITKFLSEADDHRYLMIKLAVILGVYGACRREELYNLSINHIQDKGNVLVVTIENTKTYKDRVFTIVPESTPVNGVELYRKYLKLRPSNVKDSHLFIYYKAGRCTSQRVGINTFAQLPRKVAEFLKLPDTECYTGHCFRRTSATLLADSGADITVLKRHGGWSSNSVAESYIEESIENKVKIARRIMPVEEPVALVETVSSISEVIHSGSSREVIMGEDIVVPKSSPSGSGITIHAYPNCNVNIYVNK